MRDHGRIRRVGGPEGRRSPRPFGVRGRHANRQTAHTATIRPGRTADRRVL